VVRDRLRCSGERNSSDGDNEFASGLPSFEMSHGLGHGAQRVGPFNHRDELIVLGELDAAAADAMAELARLQKLR
jgi:hypothetical protein